MSGDGSALPGQACEVFAADDLYVAHGVAQGDGLGLPEEVCPGDVYWLEPDARSHRLVLARAGGAMQVGAGSGFGRPGASVGVKARYRLMGPEGEGVEVLLLAVEGAELAALPLSPLVARTDYTLVTVEQAPEDVPLADLLCASFLRGPRITMADGSQRAIEGLHPGDAILTRDHGRQPLRWLGQATLRAAGAFAPVVIGKGVLGNAGDLAVSPHHRIFLYLRDRAPGLPTSEILVQAKHLVDGETV
ncbi:MAG TPA: Hint domain-containing protein, partial [Paracoccaceae bacterium]|nr:Hint domain-containing protein [Paracoccaceae bacterium]